MAHEADVADCVGKLALLECELVDISLGFGLLALPTFCSVTAGRGRGEGEAGRGLTAPGVHAASISTSRASSSVMSLCDMAGVRVGVVVAWGATDE